MSETKPRRTIKLFCPSVPMTASMAAWDEQRLDFGAIARTFGLDPPTVKLNGHFIGRDADLIAASVTWKSLLSFFACKGLPTGENGNKPIVVDGKLCKLGSKRRTDELENDVELVLKRQKIRRSNGSLVGVCFKRKHLVEDVNLLKKLKISESTLDVQGRRCSYMSGNVKRKREDEVVMAAPFKKIR